MKQDKNLYEKTNSDVKNPPDVVVSSSSSENDVNEESSFSEEYVEY